MADWMECRECGGGDDSNCCGVQSKFTITNGESERERGYTHMRVEAVETKKWWTISSLLLKYYKSL